MSPMHKEAEEWEATCLSAERDGGIRQAFSALLCYIGKL